MNPQRFRFFFFPIQFFLILGAKINALLDGRYNVSFEDVRRTYLPAMRHRIILNFDAHADGQTPETILTAIIRTVSAQVPAA